MGRSPPHEPNQQNVYLLGFVRAGLASLPPYFSLLPSLTLADPLLETTGLSCRCCVTPVDAKTRP
ncbi:hypothetical protein E2C01_016961 [Portunus trituberculatus]|uniref:Uncharacterized protein n=1 Tax=Portunus trituberculatus TaxID=210409 RepID=A0A5B7DSB9_PORTR|nr:hypothetical protein [Portunus trituberculatus]